MGSTNDRDNSEIRQNIKNRIKLESHINTIYLLGLISPEKKDELMELLGSVEMENNSSEIIDYISDLYHAALDSRKILDTEKEINLAKTLLKDISETLYQKGGQITLDLLDKTAGLLRGLDVKRGLFRNEIVFNIEVIRERFKNSMILDRDNINVITAMLNQFNLAEESN